MTAVQASSHREAPLISADPLADNTDVYAFVSPNAADKVTLIANFIPFEAPYGGPNFFKFDDNVLYEIMVDNNGDAVEDVTFQFRFRTDVRNPNTFLYNTGPITSLDATTFNVRQFYTVTRVDGPRRRGRGTVLGDQSADAAGERRLPLDAELRGAGRGRGAPAAERLAGVRRVSATTRSSSTSTCSTCSRCRRPTRETSTGSPASTSTRSRSKCRSRR